MDSRVRGDTTTEEGGETRAASHEDVCTSARDRPHTLAGPIASRALVLGPGRPRQAQVELQRARTLRAPAETLAMLEKQLVSAQQRARLRDDVSGALQHGKWQEALEFINKSALDDAKKQLMRAFVATVRGEFDEATTIIGLDPRLNPFRSAIVDRSAAFRAARDGALVALNFMSGRYCQG